MARSHRAAVIMLTFTIVLALVIYAGVHLLMMSRAHSADLAIVPLGWSRMPPASMANQFGTFSDHYYQRRWKKLCRGAGRYDAMREAYELGKPDPCQGMRLE